MGCGVFTPRAGSSIRSDLFVPVPWVCTAQRFERREVRQFDDRAMRRDNESGLLRALLEGRTIQCGSGKNHFQAVGLEREM